MGRSLLLLPALDAGVGREPRREQANAIRNYLQQYSFYAITDRTTFKTEYDHLEVNVLKHIGYIYRGLRYHINGSSRSNGFVLSMNYRGRFIEVATPEFDPKESSVAFPSFGWKSEKRLFGLVYGAGILLHVALLVRFSEFTAKAMAMSVFFALFWVIGVVALTALIMRAQDPRLPQKAPWHGAEHMAAIALGRHFGSASISREQLLKCPRVSLACGTYVLTSLSAVSLTLLTFFWWHTLGVSMQTAIGAAYITAVAASYLHQHYIGTADPDEQQIEAALVLADTVQRRIAEIDARERHT